MSGSMRRKVLHIGGPDVVIDRDDPHFQYWQNASARAFGRPLFHLEQMRRAFFDRMLAPHGIGSAQFPLLALLWEGHDGDTLSSLARELRVNPGTVTRTVQKLEEQGILEREVSGRDARAVKIRLTEKGWHLAAAGREASEQWNAALTEGWSVQERKSVLKALQEMARRIDAVIREQK